MITNWSYMTNTRSLKTSLESMWDHSEPSEVPCSIITPFLKAWHILKSRHFNFRELDWSNLPQNSNLGWESCVQKAGVRIPVGEGQIFCHFSFFFFTFFILSIKNWILKHKLPFLYINMLHRNKMKIVQYTYFYWCLIGKRR